MRMECSLEGLQEGGKYKYTRTGSCSSLHGRVSRREPHLREMLAFLAQPPTIVTLQRAAAISQLSKATFSLFLFCAATNKCDFRLIAESLTKPSMDPAPRSKRCNTTASALCDYIPGLFCWL